MFFFFNHRTNTEDYICAHALTTLHKLTRHIWGSTYVKSRKYERGLITRNPTS